MADRWAIRSQISLLVSIDGFLSFVRLVIRSLSFFSDPRYSNFIQYPTLLHQAPQTSSYYLRQARLEAEWALVVGKEHLSKPNIPHHPPLQGLDYSFLLLAYIRRFHIR